MYIYIYMYIYTCAYMYMYMYTYIHNDSLIRKETSTCNTEGRISM